MKRVKLGKSNDSIPEDEMILAKLIQTASARGLHSWRGCNFANPRGHSWDQDDPDMVACCAKGAGILDFDLRSNPEKLTYANSGNDAPDDVNDNLIGGMSLGDTEATGWTIGAAFEQALRKEEV